MDKKGEKRIISTIPDGSVWDSFLEHIKSVYGKTYGYIGVEVQNALKQYVENYENPDIQEVEHKYQKDVLKLQDRMFKQNKDIEAQQNSLDSFREVVEELEKENGVLQTENTLLHEVQDKYDQLHKERLNLQNRHDKLRNKHDHLQERFNKCHSELNTLERENSRLRMVVAKIEKLSFWERLLNRLPSEVKQLTTKEDLK